MDEHPMKEYLEETTNIERLSLDSAIEIDNYLLGRNLAFLRTKELAGVLDRHQLSDNTVMLFSSFPYQALIRAIDVNSEKRLQSISDLVLEMKLLTYELRDVPYSHQERLEELRSFLVKFSRECSHEMVEYREPRRELSSHP